MGCGGRQARVSRPEQVVEGRWSSEQMKEEKVWIVRRARHQWAASQGTHVAGHTDAPYRRMLVHTAAVHKDTHASMKKRHHARGGRGLERLPARQCA